MNTIESAHEFYPYTAECLPREAGVRILDLGCGTGLELDAFFALNPEARSKDHGYRPGGGNAQRAETEIQ